MDIKSIRKLHANKKTISGALTQAFEEHKKLCKENKTNRKEYLEKVMADLKERNNQGHISVKQLIQREDSRYDFKKIREIIKPNRVSGIK
jgi:phage tail tape-measure protein